MDAEEELVPAARRVTEENRSVSMAAGDEDGPPRAAPLESLAPSYANFCRRSAPQTVYTRHLMALPKVGAATPDSRTAPGTREAKEVCLVAVSLGRVPEDGLAVKA